MPVNSIYLLVGFFNKLLTFSTPKKLHCGKSVKKSEILNYSLNKRIFSKCLVKLIDFKAATAIFIALIKILFGKIMQLKACQFTKKLFKNVLTV